MKNAINWFEIPAADYSRAKQFYETVFNCQLMEMSMGEMKMAMFPADEKAVSGAVASGNGSKPSMEGTVVYLNVDGIMDETLSRVEAAGGKILLPKTLISKEIGHMAFIQDTEGNKVGFHAPIRG